MKSLTAIRMSSVLIFVALLSPQILLAKPLESKRMERAKDLIADEQWGRALDGLEAGGAGGSERAEQGRSALLARARPEPGARWRGGCGNHSPSRAPVPCQPLG